MVGKETQSDGAILTKRGDRVEVNTKIFKKGLRMFEQGKVYPEGESENAAYFAVQGEHESYKVRISADGTFNCTCMRGTLHGSTKGSICSHVVAAILYLTDRSKTEQECSEPKR